MHWEVVCVLVVVIVRQLVNIEQRLTEKKNCEYYCKKLLVWDGVYIGQKTNGTCETKNNFCMFTKTNNCYAYKHSVLNWYGLLHKL